MSDLPFDLINGFSIAMGRVNKKSKSKIHVHPHVVQVTFVLSGKIVLRMKGTNDSEPYEILLGPGEAGLCHAGEYFQLDNGYDDDCNVLYIVSPDYLFEIEGDRVIYDDAIVLDFGWEQLQKTNWSPPELSDPRNSSSARDGSYRRLSRMKQFH